MGGLWAYLILDWGGYWAWDPVETGSFLPWLALVMIVHLRTRPGTVRPEVWIGGGLITGALALFATTVTRAGGVWASSVHTFVTSDTSTPPSDVFGRLMILRDDPAGTEVMTYVAWMFILDRLLAGRSAVVSESAAVDRLQQSCGTPAVITLLGCLVFTGSNGEGLSWSSLPDGVCRSAGVAAHVAHSTKNAVSSEDDTWSYHGLTPAPFDVVFTLVVYGMTADVWIPRRHRAVRSAVPGGRCARCLALGGGRRNARPVPRLVGCLSIGVAGVMLMAYVFPWLLAPQEEEGSVFAHSAPRPTAHRLVGQCRPGQPVFVLTWVLLLTSIDAVNFEAHELYGAPFLAAAIAASLFVYTRRKTTMPPPFWLLGGAVVVSLLGFMAGTRRLWSRFHHVGFTTPHPRPHRLDVASHDDVRRCPVAREVVRQFNTSSKGSLKRIPLGAHIVHVGLLVLLLGHLSTTVLVDRGDASHRVSLVKDEVIVHDGLGLEFVGLEIESTGLEVGDGFIGVRTSTCTRWTAPPSAPALARWSPVPFVSTVKASLGPRSPPSLGSTGDMVFIFDGSQAGSLMSSASGEPGANRAGARHGLQPPPLPSRLDRMGHDDGRHGVGLVGSMGRAQKLVKGNPNSQPRKNNRLQCSYEGGLVAESSTWRQHHGRRHNCSR